VFFFGILHLIKEHFEFLTTHLCYVLVLVGIDAELDELSVDDVSQTEDRIVSQWREVSADERHQLCDGVNELLRPLGFETSLLVIRRANSLALYFICMTLAALTSLRDQWESEQLKDIVQKLFTLLSRATQTVRVKRLTWPMNDYQRCLNFFSSARGWQT